MRIIILGTRGFPNIQGGVEQHCEGLAVNLVKLGYDVMVFTRKPYVEKDIKEFKGVKLVTLPTIKHKSLEAFLHTLIGIFVALRYKPDVLHIQAIGPALFTPLARIFHKKMKEAKVSVSLDRAMESLRSIRLAYCYYPRKAQPVRKICRLSSTEKELLTALNLEIPEVR